MMRYPIAIEPGDETRAFGLVVPDLPGCFTSADMQDDVISLAREAITLWLIEALIEGRTIAQPSAIDEIPRRPEFAGWSTAWVDVEMPTIP